MGNLAIRVDNLGKRYRIGQTVGYKTLRSSLTGAFSAPFRRLRSPGSQPHVAGYSNTIWALKGVSFEVNHGEAVGIIGRNGSGKSTLLKILSRITPPTEGSAQFCGRLGSLLEVGTGFHPELTGRENIFLNGAVLGMKRVEVARKFDEIVAFAEVEKFLDTPVKHYSSGMYVRLAFAVAAHLEPEILIVDEVLAVGDAVFQKKCLGKMTDVTKEGRTVLFVSHNMAAIQSLCNRGIVLDHGQLEISAPVGKAIHYYHNLARTVDPTGLKGIHGVRILTTQIAPGSKTSGFTSNSSLVAEIDFYCDRRLPKCYFNLVIEDADGNFLIHSRTDLYNLWPTFEPGAHHVRAEVPRLSLRGGIYTVWLRLYCDNVDITEIADSARIMLEVSGPQVGGVVDVLCSWSWN